VKKKAFFFEKKNQKTCSFNRVLREPRPVLAARLIAGDRVSR
jgi:hypothetical protein